MLIKNFILSIKSIYLDLFISKRLEMLPEKVKFNNLDKVVDPNHLKELINECQKRYDETISIFIETRSKTITILLLLISILISLFGYIFISFDTQGVFDIKLTVVIVTALYVYTISCYLSKNFITSQIKPNGTKPSSYIGSGLIAEYKRENFLNYLYSDQLEEYQNRIEINESLNEIRQDRIDHSLRLLILLPLFSISVYFIIGIATLI